jgi:uncharacterized membrane protein
MAAIEPPPRSATSPLTDPESLDIVARLVAEQYSGQFPHPDLLERYEALAPGCSKQLFDDAHAQTQHRIQLERIAVKGDDFRATVGVFVGAIIGVGGLVLAGYFAYKGESLTGLGAVILDVGTLAGVYLYGSHSRRQERTDKAADISSAPLHRRGRSRLDAEVRSHRSETEQQTAEAQKDEPTADAT